MRNAELRQGSGLIAELLAGLGHGHGGIVCHEGFENLHFKLQIRYAVSGLVLGVLASTPSDPGQSVL